MEEVGMFAEEESHPRNPINNEEDNVRDGEISVNLNESETNNPCELQRTVKDLRLELKWLREDNEWILKAQEELNNIILAKIHNYEKEKNKESKHIMPKSAPYKHKGRKLEFFSHKVETFCEELVKHHSKNNKI